jgi:Tfp pilus assembly protein PilF
MTRGALAALLVAGLLIGRGFAIQPAVTQAPPADREAAYRANNVGIGYLEQFDYDKAVESFRRALAIDSSLDIARLNLAIALFYANNPDGALQEGRLAAERMPESPHAHYLLGLLARAQNRTTDAIAEFRRVLEKDAADVGAKVNLGQVYVQERNFEAAITLLREAIAAEPFNVTAAYNLATALTRSGAQEEGRAAMERFQTLRDSAYGTTYAQTYLAQGKYAEAVASTGAEPELVNPAAPAVSFTDATTTMLPASKPGQGAPATAAGVAAISGGLTLFDADNDGDLDLVEAGASGLRFFRNAKGMLSEAGGTFSVEPDGISIATVAGDYDNDGRPDLFVLRSGGNRLLHQQADGRFEDVTAVARIPANPSLTRSAAFADVDHDGDLDLFIVGFQSAAASPNPQASANQLLRNNGDGTFTDITATAKVAGGGAAGIAVVPTDFDNRRDMDLLIVSRGGAPVLFQNVRDGSFRDAAADARLPPAGAYSAVAAADVNKDGYTDFFFGSSDGPGTFATSDGSGRFVSAPAPASTAGAVASQFVDYDNDGLLDLLVLTERTQHLLRNLGSRWVEVKTDGLSPGATPFQSMAIGDLDGDGDEDVAVRLAGGAVHIWRNDGGNANRSLQVRLTGRVSNRSGVGSKIDIRSGSLRQRLESSAAAPAGAPADLRFGLGNRSAADAVRVLWPSGILQTEIALAAAPGGAAPASSSVLTVTELDRKPSSCPFLYTWNGSRFEFVTDFMGGGELGYWEGPQHWNHPDPDEYVRIRGDQLKPRDGRYELRVTNELEETTFIDRLQLIAVDLPAGVEVYPNEGLREGGSGFGLTATRGARPASRAIDDDGRDVTARLVSIDRNYPDAFRLAAIRGYAEPHALTLDLGVDASRAVLLMTGWTDYAFSGDNVAASHSGRALTPPSLQVKDASGAWRTVIKDIGIPVGRPQTVVVNLGGKVPDGSREVRIMTNMRIYWDQVLVDSSGGEFATVLTRIEPSAAHLHWRGFSAESTPDGREPYGYDYARVSTISPWKQMTGSYTREGDVKPLLRQVDDRFVVSRPGDEIALSFDASALPPLRAGTSRTFLLYADGYSKEMDINSASPDSVEPLPFHGMTKYPYGPGERYPHRETVEQYNTRVVVRGY